jgi:hypothetical protein
MNVLGGSASPGGRGARLRRAVGLTVLALAAACGRDTRADAHGSARWPLASFTDRDVAVDIALERDSAGKTWLAGRFAPTRPGYHLYGKDLPKTGLRGIGRPTLLEVVRAPGLRPSGALVADRAPGELKVPEIGLTFPVYPAGPVTLRQPVTLDPAQPRDAELSVTYMACTEGTCLAPAIDRRVHVSLPKP